MNRSFLLKLGVALAFAAIAFAPSPGGEEKKGKRPSPQAVKALNEALRLLQAKQTDAGIEKLKEIVESFPEDPAVEKAKDLLRENGVGEEVRVRLLKSESFRERFKITERSVLDDEEKILGAIRGNYAKLKKPYFKESTLDLYFFDSQARYREKTGLITTAGNFNVAKVDLKERSLQGKIEWYFPIQAGSVKDRETSMRGLLYHETTHYLDYVHFGGSLPQFLEEGLATYFESRLNQDYFQSYRATIRQHRENDARNGLGAITKYDAFVKLLDAPRGFGQGDAMLERWYGLCYAIVDFMSEGEIGSKRSSVLMILEALEKKLNARIEKDAEKEKSKGLKKIPSFPARALLEDLVKEFFEVPLETFHKELTKHILAKYKQH